MNFDNFQEKIQKFFTDIQIDEPYVLQRKIPTNKDQQQSAIKPLLFCNKNSHSKSNDAKHQKKIQKKLLNFYNESIIENYDEKLPTISADTDEDDHNSNESMLYQIIFEILKKYELIYCNSNQIFGPIFDYLKENFYATYQNEAEEAQQQSTMMNGNDRLEKFQQYYSENICKWIIIMTYYDEIFQKYSRIIRWLCRHVYIPYRYPSRLLSSLDDKGDYNFNDDIHDANKNFNYDDGDDYKDKDNDFALRLSLSIIYYLVQYRLYWIEKFQQFLLDIKPSNL